MKYAGKELFEMWDIELIQHYHKLIEAEEIRDKASKHHKFMRNDNKAMKFPPPNPVFKELKSAILNEIETRKLEI